MPPRKRKSDQIPPVLASLVEGVAETLEQVPAKPEDAAVRALVTRYAQTIEDARGIADALGMIVVAEGDDAGRKQLATLAAKVEAHQVMVDLGPKLLAALDAMGATPKARSAQNGGTPNVGGNPAVGTLARIQARRGVLS